MILGRGGRRLDRFAHIESDSLRCDTRNFERRCPLHVIIIMRTVDFDRIVEQAFQRIPARSRWRTAAFRRASNSPTKLRYFRVLTSAWRAIASIWRVWSSKRYGTKSHIT